LGAAAGVKAVAAVADGSVMTRRVGVLLSSLLLSICANAAASPGSASTWDGAQQQAAMQDGYLHAVGDGRFHGEQPLTGGQMNDSLLQLGFGASAPALTTASRFVTVTGFDRLVVDQLGLADAAATAQAQAARAGLDPPRYFGTEVAARLLGLRYNHPFPVGEHLELYPW